MKEDGREAGSAHDMPAAGYLPPAASAPRVQPSSSCLLRLRSCEAVVEDVRVVTGGSQRDYRVERYRQMTGQRDRWSGVSAYGFGRVLQ
jgi:hypothetical protein